MRDINMADGAEEYGGQQYQQQPGGGATYSPSQDQVCWVWCGVCVWGLCVFVFGCEVFKGLTFADL